jgi:acyl dehydratase
MKYLQDLKTGERSEIGSHTFTAEAIKRFGVKFDPQPFHIDEAAAARTLYGGLIASGWQTAAVCMRLLVDYRTREEAAERARGETSARTGISPGFRDLKWLKPVHVGDTITYTTEVIEKRPVQSRPGWGLVFWLCTGTNQAGDRVFSFIGTMFLERRPG